MVETKKVKRFYFLTSLHSDFELDNKNKAVFFQSCVQRITLLYMRYTNDDDDDDDDDNDDDDDDDDDDNNYYYY